MYDYLEGQVRYKRAAHQLIVAVGGVGYRIEVCEEVYETIPVGSVVVCFYVHHRQTDDAVYLYGFLKQTERDFFELLISVSGIGPKLGLKILSQMPYKEIIHKITREDKEGLSKIGGLGPKIVMKVFLELKDKLSIFEDDFSQADVVSESDLIHQTRQALRTLGYRAVEIDRVVPVLIQEMESASNRSTSTGVESTTKLLEDYVRRALGLLSSLGDLNLRK